MSEPFKVAIVGLDTSHSVELPRLMQDPATPPEKKVPELRATRCLRFPTPFQDKAGLDQRQQYLESIGVKVTTNFDEAVADCDAILVEINDPSLHEEYFARCAKLGKPVFLDKPFADTVDSTRRIIVAAKENNIRFFTSSSLRFDFDFQQGLAKKINPQNVTVWGPVGTAKAGSSIVWYGVHAFEMLQTAMGFGAVSLSGVEDANGYVFFVQYEDGRRGVVELSRISWAYGSCIRDNENNGDFTAVTCKIPFYQMLLKEIVKFLNGEQPVSLQDSFEVMAMLEAADTAIKTGKSQKIARL